MFFLSRHCLYINFMALIYCSFYDISVADAVVSETDEVKGKTEESTEIVVSDTLAAEKEISNKQGEDLHRLVEQNKLFSG